MVWTGLAGHQGSRSLRLSGGRYGGGWGGGERWQDSRQRCLGLYPSSSYQAQTCLPGLKGLVSTCKISFPVEVKELKHDFHTHEG